MMTTRYGPVARNSLSLPSFPCPREKGKGWVGKVRFTSVIIHGTPNRTEPIKLKIVDDDDDDNNDGKVRNDLVD